MAQVPKDKGNRTSVSGTNISGGIISLEEYNRKLTGRAGLNIYDEMRRSDGTTSAALRIVKLPILSATWKVSPASDDEQDIKIADTIQHNLDYIGWEQILKEIMLFLDFGFSVFEKVYDVVDSEYGSYIGICELGSLKPTTIHKWEQKGGDEGITQLDPNGPQISLPAEKIIVFTNDMEGKNYEGKPLLRPAYKHWYMKESLYKIDALAHEKQGLGIPNLEVPEGASSTDTERAREIARNIRANEAAFAEMPEGFKLSFLDMQANSTRDPMNSINHHTTQIMKSVLAQFLELGSNTSKSGSQALSTDHSDLFMKAEEATANYIKERIQKFFIKDIVEMNFPNAKAMPTLEYSDLSDTDTQKLADSVQKLMTVNAITAEPELEDHLRKIYDLPDLPDEIRNNYDNRTLSNAGTPQPTSASLNDVLKSLDNYIEASLNATTKRRRTNKR